MKSFAIFRFAPKKKVLSPSVPPTVTFEERTQTEKFDYYSAFLERHDRMAKSVKEHKNG